jgi:hypothetical protein
MTTKKPTQQERILKVLEAVQSGHHKIPEEYIRRHPCGDGISTRYFKQVMLVSECNGRISELRAKGYNIETSKVTDQWGFCFHRLNPSRITSEDWFDNL